MALFGSTSHAGVPPRSVLLLGGAAGLPSNDTIGVGAELSDSSERCKDLLRLDCT